MESKKVLYYTDIKCESKNGSHIDLSIQKGLDYNIEIDISMKGPIVDHKDEPEYAWLNVMQTIPIERVKEIIAEIQQFIEE